MELLKKLVFALVLLIALFAIGGLFLPSTYQVERSIVINAPKEKVYPYVVNLENWPQWGVWFKRDPNMTVEFDGPDRAIGMRMSWLSETEGNGNLAITGLEHESKVSYILAFPEMGTQSNGYFSLQSEAVNASTKVTWHDSGELGMNPINRYFGLILDGMIGPDFETGLENLKTIVEMDE